MKLTQEIGSGTYRIRSFKLGQVLINDETIEQNVIVTPNELVRDWAPGAEGEIRAEDIAGITALDPELVILGTGERQRFPDRMLLRDLIQRGIGVEVMDTASACRTYNILMAEDRRVAAALLLR